MKRIDISESAVENSIKLPKEGLKQSEKSTVASSLEKGVSNTEEKSENGKITSTSVSVRGDSVVNIKAISQGKDAPPKVEIKTELKEDKGATACGIITVCLSSAFLLTMTGFGYYYMDECPVSRMLPIWLIVAGFLPLISIIICSILHSKGSESRSKKKKQPIVLQVLNGIILFILGLWLVYGTIIYYYLIVDKIEYNDSLISSNSNSSTETSNKNDMYCHKNVYIFFIGTVPLCVTIALLLLCTGIVIACTDKPTKKK